LAANFTAIPIEWDAVMPFGGIRKADQRQALNCCKKPLN
jgi:hypothetical protein